MWLRIAAKCTSGMRVEALADNSSIDPTEWVRGYVDVACADGAGGPLYIFIGQPPDAALAAVLGWVAVDRRLQPAVVAPTAALASGADLKMLQRSGAWALYVTLCGATAAVHDARTGETGSWRRALRLLLAAPREAPRLRVGVHLQLSPESMDELPGILRLVRSVSDTDLLLWDAGCSGMGSSGVDPAAALQALDFAVTAAQRSRVRMQAVGFERLHAAVAKANAKTCVASAAVVTLLREGIGLPSAGAGVLAADGTSAVISEVAPNGEAIAQLAHELAAGGVPLLDLPPCLGGPPPESGSTREGSLKVGACQQCPIDHRCLGVPRSILGIPGVGNAVRPPQHWMAMRETARVLVCCPVVTEPMYGATFFSLARCLARLGARVDLLTPWAMHADVSPAFPETQSFGQPEGASAIDTFISQGPVERYDLIVMPDTAGAHPLVINGRLRKATRLAVTDFHMLGGMKAWVRDLRAPGRRPEDGGWWPSERVILYSAFPGFARLYTRYGVPMRQVAWQPYALDPACFSAAQPVADAAAIVSGGNHRRDLETLLAAAGRLGRRVHPIDLFASVPVPHVPPQIRFGGEVATSTYCEVVARSRFMVVPLLPDPHYAAGVTAMATAMMCGRPVVATATATTRDYVIDGVNGLLVPPGDPQAMAAAIERLDTDTSLLVALAAGAREAAHKLTTDAWARALLQGSRAYEMEHWMWTKWRSRLP